jgi:hypothetical protein
MCGRPVKGQYIGTYSVGDVGWSVVSVLAPVVGFVADVIHVDMNTVVVVVLSSVSVIILVMVRMMVCATVTLPTSSEEAVGIGIACGGSLSSLTTSQDAQGKRSLVRTEIVPSRARVCSFLCDKVRVGQRDS